MDHIDESLNGLLVEAKNSMESAGFSTFVWGTGNPQSGIVILGEAPGADEVAAAAPFVGKAGKFLRSELQAILINPEEIWITNVVKHRPTKGCANSLSNRPPTRDEIDFWMPYLQRELEIIKPRKVLCLGTVAAAALIGKCNGMRDIRGKWNPSSFGAHIMVTYHPSYVLRAQRMSNQQISNYFRIDLEKFFFENG